MPAYPRIGRDRSNDLRLGIHSFPVEAYVLFYREPPDGTVLVVRPMVPVIAALVAAIHVFVDPRDKPAGDG